MNEELAKKVQSDINKKIDDIEIDPRQHPLESIAESIYFIERHLKAIVYMQRCNMSEGHMNFLPENFNAIYTGEDIDLGTDFNEDSRTDNSEDTSK